MNSVKQHRDTLLFLAASTQPSAPVVRFRERFYNQVYWHTLHSMTNNQWSNPVFLLRHIVKERIHEISMGTNYKNTG